MKLIDAERDRLVPVQQICKERLGKRVSPATLWRWIHRGTKGGRLEAVYAASVWMTTPEAFADFITRMTAARLSRPVAGDDDLPPARSPETERKLRELGLLR